MSKEIKITGGVAVLAALAGSACTTTKHAKFENPGAGSKAAIEYGGTQGAEFPSAQIAQLIFQYPANVGEQIESQAYNVRTEADKDAAGMLNAKGKEGFCKVDVDKATLGVDRLKRHAVTKDPTGFNDGVGLTGDKQKGRGIMDVARKRDIEVMDTTYRGELKDVQTTHCGAGKPKTSTATIPSTGNNPAPQTRRLVSAPPGMPPINITITTVGDGTQNVVGVGTHASGITVRRQQAAETENHR